MTDQHDEIAEQAERLNNALATFEEYLRHHYRVGAQVVFQCNGSACRLMFDKVGDTWGLRISTTDCDSIPIRSASIAKRIAAVHALGGLEHALMAAQDRTAANLAVATARVHEILEVRKWPRE